MAVECGGMRWNAASRTAVLAGWVVWRGKIDTVVAVARHAAAGMVKRSSKSTATKIYALAVAFGVRIERIRDTLRKGGEEVPSRHGVGNVLKRGRDGQNLTHARRTLAGHGAKLDDEPWPLVREMKVLPILSPSLPLAPLAAAAAAASCRVLSCRAAAMRRRSPHETRILIRAAVLDLAQHPSP